MISPLLLLFIYTYIINQLQRYNLLVMRMSAVQPFRSRTQLQLAFNDIDEQYYTCEKLSKAFKRLHVMGADEQKIALINYK